MDYGWKGESVLIEPTAGNTGTALAWIALLKGYSAIIVLPNRMSPDKDIILKGFHAHVVRAPNVQERELAAHLAETVPNAVLLDQFNNPENAVAHEPTTGPELIECIESTVGGSRSTSDKIDAFFAGCGTGGTPVGVSKAIKKKHNPDVKIIACDPVGFSDNSSPVSFTCLELPLATSSISQSGSIIARPESLNDPQSPLGLKGIGVDRLKWVPQTVEYEEISQWVQVTNEDGYTATLELHRREALIVGGSSGGIVAGALSYLKSAVGWATLGGVEGKNAICLLPDGEWFTRGFEQAANQEQSFAKFIANGFKHLNLAVPTEPGV